LKYKYGIDKTIPDDWKPPRAPKTLEEVKKEDELIAKAKAGKLSEKPEKAVPERGPGVRTFNVFVEGEYYEVDVEAVGGSPVITVSPRASAFSPSTTPSTTKKAPPKVGEKKEPPAAVAEGTKVPAPMPGMIIRYLVSVDDKVKAGDTLLILEAMKMQNNISAPVDGVVKTITFGAGDSVNKGDILAVIA
jgi:biotin carboxyl carrier protein